MNLKIYHITYTLSRIQCTSTENRLIYQGRGGQSKNYSEMLWS